mmetsp:Transcript_31849/g.93153  ORF Transcript_31849/g.93153 Transcript_31849/m.93153 type:complete len:231 (+) Transcript_31849:1756-2448(+)
MKSEGHSVGAGDQLRHPRERAVRLEGLSPALEEVQSPGGLVVVPAHLVHPSRQEMRERHQLQNPCHNAILAQQILQGAGPRALVCVIVTPEVVHYHHRVADERDVLESLCDEAVCADRVPLDRSAQRVAVAHVLEPFLHEQVQNWDVLGHLCEIPVGPDGVLLLSPLQGLFVASERMKPLQIVVDEGDVGPDACEEALRAKWILEAPIRLRVAALALAVGRLLHVVGCVT